MDEERSECPRRRGRYLNPHIVDEKRTLWDVILWRLGYYSDGDLLPKKPDGFIYPSPIQPFKRDLPSAVWIGHSTYLVDFGGFCLLTDPVWDLHCSPIPISSLKRHTEVPFPLEAIGPLDLVLISHNHYDHLDEKSVLKIAQSRPELRWMVPKGLSPWFRRRGIDHVVELDWWKSTEVMGHRITAVPAQHFSGRTLWDKNKTLWNGYVVESLATGKKLYFVGDTGYNEVDFKEIGRRFAPIDLSLIPIGTYSPRIFMAPVHSSPYDGVAIHADVGSQLSLGMHWKTFHLSDEPLDRPPYDLYLAMKEKNLSFATFLPVDIGTYINW
jgi:N-acyl-phosphatidylethanolamine-hydrolysing phospholipase D